MNKPHVHAEVIKAWADGAEIEYFSCSYQCWMPIAKNSNWYPDVKYRVKQNLCLNITVL